MNINTAEVDAVILFYSVVLSHFELDEVDGNLVLLDSTRVTLSWTKLTVILFYSIVHELR